MRRSCRRIIVIMASTLLASGPALSAAAEAPAAPSVDRRDVPGAKSAPPIATEPSLERTRPISLDEAIALGLRNNLDVEVNRYAPEVARLDAESAWGAYDPYLSSEVSYHSEVLPKTNSFVGGEFGETYTTGGKGGLRALLPFVGASLSLGFNGDRNVSNSVIQSFSPQYSSGLNFAADVPLLRGLIWNEPWTQVKRSRIAYGSSLDSFTATVMDTVQRIIGSYWDLVAAKEQLRVARKSLESNAALLDQTKTQYEVGVVSRVEVVQAEAGVANSEFNLIVTQNDYRNAQDSLIASVLGDQLRADTELVFDPSDNPRFEGAEPVDPAAAVATAFARRPEIAAARKAIEQGDLQLRFAKNQRLPQLDLNLSYTTLGISGEQNEHLSSFFGSANPDLIGGFGGSFNDYFGQPRDFTVKGVFSIPIPNTTARRGVTKARIGVRRANSELARLRQGIVVSVRAASRGLLAAAQGVEAAERRRLAAEEQLRAERIRLEHGESTPFDVLQRDRDLVDAESQKIAALRAFRVSQAALERAEGTILDKRSVVVSEVSRLR